MRTTLRHREWQAPAAALLLLIAAAPVRGQTIAAWPFDEQAGIYPSCVLNDVSPNGYALVIGPGGKIVPSMSIALLMPSRLLNNA